MCHGDMVHAGGVHMEAEDQMFLQTTRADACIRSVSVSGKKEYMCY